MDETIHRRLLAGDQGMAPQSGSIESKEFIVSGQNISQGEIQGAKSPARKNEFNSSKSRVPEQVAQICKFYIQKLKSIKKSA